MHTSKNSIHIIIYGVVGAIQISGELWEIHILADAAKSALMPTLALYLWRSEIHNEARYPLFMGLFFSWIGDLLLINGSDQFYFLLGMLSFFLAHVAYILTFSRAGANWTESRPLKIFMIFIALGGAYFNFCQLSPGLGDMTIYVLAYTIIIIAMMIFAALRMGGTNNYSLVLAFGGALLFVLSDSIIGYSRFVSPIPFGHSYVMITYVLAQGSIVSGLVRHGHVDNQKIRELE